MTRQNIPFDQFVSPTFRAWGDDWFLLSAGSVELNDFHMMTVGWGMCGTMWGKPAAMILVRPQRHTKTFLDRYDTFTLCAFPREYRKALTLLGSLSGHDCPDKIHQSGLTPCPARNVLAPAYEEAELVLECSNLYRTPLRADGFLDTKILDQSYPDRDLHVITIAEVIAIQGVSKFLAGAAQ